MIQIGMPDGGKRKTEDGTVQIRPMCPADIPAVAELDRQIFSEPWSEQGFEEALLGQQNLFLVAEPEDDVIAGYIGLYGSYDEGDITNVAVAEAFRGNGIGTLLVKSMKEMAVRRGIRRIYLEVRDSNETAQRVYEKAGFSVCGRRKKFYRQPEEDAVLMCLHLDGEY